MVSADPRWNSGGSCADPVTRSATRVGGHPCRGSRCEDDCYRLVWGHCRDRVGEIWREMCYELVTAFEEGFA